MITARYFAEDEFRRCTPACSLQDMNQRTMDRLDHARDLAGIPFILNSAYRSSAWDQEKGRTGSGAHTRGRAVDIRCRTNATRMRVVVALLAAGFSRIGIADTFIHADDDETLTQDIIWLY